MYLGTYSIYCIDIPQLEAYTSIIEAERPLRTAQVKGTNAMMFGVFIGQSLTPVAWFGRRVDATEYVARYRLHNTAIVREMQTS